MATKKRGRPRANTTPLTVRLRPEHLSRIDEWISRRPAPQPSRPEAIRQLLDAILHRGPRMPAGVG